MWVVLLSLLLTVPISAIVDRAFKWLRSPVVTAVEHKKVTVQSLIKSARAAQKTVFDEGRRAGEKVLEIGRNLLHLQENEGAFCDPHSLAPSASSLTPPTNASSSLCCLSLSDASLRTAHRCELGRAGAT